MAYIGRQLVRGQNRVLDDISSSFNGSTTAFNLTVSSSSSPPASVNQLWIILGGILQKPGTDFTVADAVITFTTAPASTLSFWGMIQGDTSDINSPADASVTPSKIANSGDFAFPADVRFKDADGSHYVGLQAPSTVSSNLVWTLPAADGSANQLLKTDGSGALGWASDANAPEGTSVLSTGETGTTKYLRVDGDNTCSWQLAVDATKTTLTGSTNNTITTVTGANAIQGEANLTYDGTTLLSNADTAGLTLRDSSAYAANTGCQISFQGKDSNEATKAFGAIKGLSVSADNGQLRFQTRTGGTLYDRLTIQADGKVGILETTPLGTLHVKEGDSGVTNPDNSQDTVFIENSANAGITIATPNANTGYLTFADPQDSNVGQIIYRHGEGESYANTMSFFTNAAERVRIDSAGRLLVNTTTAMDTGSGDLRDTIQATHTAGAQLLLARNDQVTNATNRLGEIAALGNDSDGTFKVCGSIRFEAELAHDTNDKPTAIVFKTCADNSTTLTERLRIQAGGGISFNGDTSASNALNDYEIGAWTVTDDSGAGLTFNINHTARYVKIGNLVNIQFDITFPSTSNTAHPKFNNPFTGGHNYGGGHVNWTNYAGGLVVHVGVNDMWLGKADDSDSSFQNADLSGKRVIANVCYQIS